MHAAVDMRIAKTYKFEAAHRMTRVPEGHPCAQMHGHSFRAEIMVEGEPDSEIDACWKPIGMRLDHSIINHTLPNPTAENLARWIWDQASITLPRLYRVTLWETDDARCEYEGR